MLIASYPHKTSMSIGFISFSGIFLSSILDSLAGGSEIAIVLFIFQISKNKRLENTKGENAPAPEICRGRFLPFF